MKIGYRLKASIAAIATVLAVAGCQNADIGAEDNAQVMSALPDLPATLPLETGEATDAAYAPEVSDLPDAPQLRPARIADRNEAYGYADAAYSYADAVGDAPPDYGFDYDGVEPWAWQGYDDSTMFAEPIDDGYRYYYYRPGASEPYFVRDPYYSYGFAGGMLAVIYAADGGIVSYSDYGPRLGYASRYFARGRSLYGASRRARRQPVIVANWFARSPIIFASRQRWGAGRAHQPAWNAYHAANRPRQQNYWREEQVRRQADSRRLVAWRDNGFRSAAPPRAIPAAWSNARWARDDRRYRPAGDTIREAARQDRQQDARQAEARRDRVEDRRDAVNDRARAERRNDGGAAIADRQRERRQDERQPQQAQAGRQQDRQRAERQQERAQADRRQERAQTERQRERTQADRRQPDAPRAERGQDRQTPQRDAAREQAQAQRQQAQQAERAQRQQAQQGQQRQAERAQAQAQRQQAQQAERAQRQQAQQGEQRQAERAQAQAQRQQAQQAQQAERAQRQQAQPQPQRAQPQQAQPQQAQPQRQQAQEQRQQSRQERRAERRDGPN